MRKLLKSFEKILNKNFITLNEKKLNKCGEKF